MAYNEFAYFYDEFNGEADYDALYEQIRQELNAHNIRMVFWLIWAVEQGS